MTRRERRANRLAAWRATPPMRGVTHGLVASPGRKDETMQADSDPERESDPYALPNVEVPGLLVVVPHHSGQ